MRTQLSKYSMGLAFCLASFAAAATGCTSTAGTGSEESQQADEIAAPLSADRIAELSRQPKIDAKELTALLGDKVPAGAGDACTGIGTSCAPDENGIIVPCGGFDSTCDSTGIQTIRKIHFFCLPGGGGNTCQAIADQTTQQVSCTVPTEGKSCTSGCGAEHCDAYSSTCDVDTNKVRTCFTGGSCHNDACSGETATVQITGSCTRETAGLRCQQGEVTPPAFCQAPKAPICAVNHLCECLTGAQ
jgi:hypothetical protein